jgi:hypothetical protein
MASSPPTSKAAWITRRRALAWSPNIWSFSTRGNLFKIH